jgi:glycosyltransferase involved in cell wall biosynthesis
MATLYTTAAVLLFPSHYEGFSLPILEAQMCGTPVVCSDRGALPEVGNSSTLLCNPTQVAALTTASHDAINANGSKNLPHQFSATHWQKAYQDTYAPQQNVISA